MIVREGQEEETSVAVGESMRSLMAAAEVGESTMNRKERRKATKKEKRKQKRKELAEKVREEEDARLDDPEEQRRIQLEEEREKERMEREKRQFEERERLFLKAVEARRAAELEEEERRKSLEEAEKMKQNTAKQDNELDEDEEEEWEYVEEGPPEIIWQGNEIIVKKKKVRVRKKDVTHQQEEEDPDRPTSNPLPPQSEAFSNYKNASAGSAQELLENAAQQIPNFGTEQDKAHCPFHLKTGACRFGSRCSRVHFYPVESCTILMKNMYNGPGLALEQDEGLEYTDEEVEHSYEEFYEDVHTEFLKYGEIVNFKVCRNGSFHLRGNVYVHYKSLDSAVFAFQSINGRYFAGKQVKCEFVNVSKWRVAICGEFMKSRLKTCSHGSACNFIHCFRNPGGDYEWADWDKPPPKYWMKRMIALFGYSNEPEYDQLMEHENRSSNRMPSAERDRCHFRRSLSRDRNHTNRTSRKHHEEHDFSRSPHGQWNSSDGRNQKMYNGKVRDHQWSKKRTLDASCSDQDWSDKDRDGHHGRTRKMAKRQIEESDHRHYHRESTGRGLPSISDEDPFSCDRDSKELQRRSRRLERQNKVSEIRDNFDGSGPEPPGTGFDGDGLEENGQKQQPGKRKKKGSRRRSELSASPDDHFEYTTRTQDREQRLEWSDGDTDRHHIRSVRRSVGCCEARESPDGYVGSRVAFNKKRGQNGFEVCNKGEKSNSSNDTICWQQCDRAESRDVYSAPPNSRGDADEIDHYDSRKGVPRRRRKSKGARSSDERYGIRYQYNERGESGDSCHDADEDVGKRGRWEPDKSDSEKLLTDCVTDDYRLFSDKYNTPIKS